MTTEQAMEKFIEYFLQAVLAILFGILAALPVLHLWKN
jgi:hypothetical protein